MTARLSLAQCECFQLAELLWSESRSLPVLFCFTASSTECGALIATRHLHQGITVSLECCAVGHSKALAAALLAA